MTTTGPLVAALDAKAVDPLPVRGLPLRCPRCASPQITSWGILYYAFPVLAQSIAADTGWSTTTITAAFSLGLIVSALAGIPVGRILDHRRPRSVMTVGPVAGAAALITVATATNLIVFTFGWVIAGIAMAATFYPAAFAALTRWYGPRRVRALTTLTLAGGLARAAVRGAKTALAGSVGWRHTYLILSVTLLLVAGPPTGSRCAAPGSLLPPSMVTSRTSGTSGTTWRRSPSRSRSPCWPPP